MAQFTAFDPKVEVNGTGIIGFIEFAGTFKKMILNILAKHGIVNPTGKDWYLQQAWLDAYREIYEQVGVKTLKQIGKQLPEKALWPPAIDTVEKALASLDMAYHMNHRGGEIGFYRFEKTGEHSGKVVCHNPYPCPFDEGLIETAAKKFALPGARVHVKHDESQPCRLKGGETCTYLISW